MTGGSMDDIQHSFRPSTIGWLVGTAGGLGIVVIGLAGFAATIATAGDWGAWPLVLTGIAVAAVLVKWLANLAATYEITPERLIIRRGLIMKSIDEIELYRIKDVRLNFSLLNQAVGIGRLTLSSSDETTRSGDLVIHEVPNARTRREELRRLVDQARQRRRVREIDMVHEDFP